MKNNNKPLLFINSAQTENKRDQNQYVYDSRYHKPINIPHKKKEEPTRKEEREVNKVEEVKEEDSRIEEEIFEELEDDTIDKKLLNKMELLDKRAKLSRCVLVTVKLKDEHEIEGYFTDLLRDTIVIQTDDEEEEIPIKYIDDIIILKV